MMNSAYIYAGIAAAAFAGGFWLNGQLWQAKWAERDAADAQSLVAMQEREREKEIQWQNDLEKIANDAKHKQANLNSDITELHAVIERLRDKIGKVQPGKASANTAATDISRAAATDKVVYSVMLESAVIRAGELAEFADRSRVAGLTCQAAYDALR